jgi:hypothetical protein
MSDPKEPRFFSHIDSPPKFTGPGDAEKVNGATVRTEADYLKLFTGIMNGQLGGEATTTYFGDEAAYRHIAERVDNPRIVILLRNPIERAFSCYQYKRNQGLEPAAEFEQALDEEPERIKEGWAPIWHYVQRGLYAWPVAKAFEIFGKDAVRVYRYENFVKSPASVLEDLAEFFALDSKFPTDSGMHHNAAADSGKKKAAPSILERVKYRFDRLVGTPEKQRKACAVSEVSDATFERLRKVFAEDQTELGRLLNWDLADWQRR